MPMVRVYHTTASIPNIPNIPNCLVSSPPNVSSTVEPLRVYRCVTLREHYSSYNVRSSQAAMKLLQRGGGIEALPSSGPPRRTPEPEMQGRRLNPLNATFDTGSSCFSFKR